MMKLHMTGDFSKNTIVVPAKNREEWLKVHTATIGGSTAGPCLGHGRFKSRRDVWDVMHSVMVECKDPVPLKETDDMRRGNVFENVAIELFRDRLVDEGVGGVWGWDQSHFVNNKNYPWAHALPDGVVGDSQIIEVKCPRPQTVQKVLTNGLFADWEYQAQHNMAVCEARICHVVILDTLSGLIHHIPISYDEAFVEQMMIGEEQFYQSILNNEPPPQEEFADIPDDEGKVIVQTDDAESYAETYMRLQEIAAETKEAMEATKAKLVAACDNAQVAEVPGIARIYHKPQAGRRTVNKAWLEKAHPEIVSDEHFYKLSKPSRPFRIYDLRTRA